MTISYDEVQRMRRKQRINCIILAILINLILISYVALPVHSL